MDRSTPFEERLQKHLFSNADVLKEVFSASEYPRVLRLRQVYQYMNENPLLPDKMYVDYVMKVHDVKRRMAQMDVAMTRPFLSNVKLISKQYLRHAATQETLEQMANAKEIGNIELWDKLLGKLIKLNALDKDDKEPMPYEMIVPLPSEPTGDVSIIKGKRPIPDLDAVAAKLRARYGVLKNIDAIQDINYEEINARINGEE